MRSTSRLASRIRIAAVAAGLAGNDRLGGGAGNVAISVISGGTDTVDCGPGFDRVTKYRTDRVVNCESIG